LFSDTTYQCHQKSSPPLTESTGRCLIMDGQKKTLLIRQKSFEYNCCINIVKLGSDLSVPIYPSGWSWHLTVPVAIRMNVTQIERRLSRLLRAISLSLS
jgi:hypothetical protein